MVRQSFPEDSADRPVESPSLLRRQASGIALWVEPGTEECLVDVDVAETGDDRLIEQDAFQTTAPATEQLSQQIGRETTREGLGAETRIERGDLGHLDVENAAELTLIGETNLCTVVQHNREMLKAFRRCAGGQVNQISGHPEVDQQGGSVVEIDDQVFAATTEFRDTTTLEANTDGLGIVVADNSREIPESQRDDLAADQRRFETPANRFDFRQFWHTDNGPRGSSSDARSMVARRIPGSRMTDSDGTERDCIFCKIARGEFGTEFVAEGKTAVAFRDLHPQAPTHVLVIPRRHVASLSDLGPDDGDLAAELLTLAARVARDEGVVESGYRVLTNTGADAGQTVFHLHLHVLGGRRLSGGLA